jgi:hypothetical protein
MPKPKRKNIPRNFLQYFVDEYILLRREFSYLVNTSPANLAAILKAINRYRDSSHTKNVFVIPTIRHQNNVWHIELVTKRRDGGDAARVEAWIYENGNNSDLRGTTSGQGLGQLTLILLSYFMLAPLFSPIMMTLGLPYLYLLLMYVWVSSPLIILISALIWRMDYINTSHILKLIQNAVESAHEHSDKAKAS